MKILKLMVKQLIVISRVKILNLNPYLFYLFFKLDNQVFNGNINTDCRDSVGLNKFNIISDGFI